MLRMETSALEKCRCLGDVRAASCRACESVDHLDSTEAHVEQAQACRVLLPVLLEPCFPLLLFTMLFLLHIVVRLLLSLPMGWQQESLEQCSASWREEGNLIFENLAGLCYVLNGAGWPEFFR